MAVGLLVGGSAPATAVQRAAASVKASPGCRHRAHKPAASPPPAAHLAHLAHFNRALLPRPWRAALSPVAQPVQPVQPAQARGSRADD